MASTSMGARRLAGLTAMVFLGLVPLARLAGAQTGAATISGQVRDESGGVLPGVTVSAKSPALQVPEVTTVTDAQGEYRLTPLPIGTYIVAYVLSGFQTIHREDIRLTAGFTARVDIQLKVGQLEETVTVSGASPLVDASSTATATQLTKEALELVPTSRNGYIGLMQQAPGARPNLDVGGSTTNAQPAFRAFGQQGQSWQAVDGVVTANPKSDTQSGNYVDYSILEEATISTIGHEASIPTRGIAINSIVKLRQRVCRGWVPRGGGRARGRAQSGAVLRQGPVQDLQVVVATRAGGVRHLGQWQDRRQGRVGAVSQAALHRRTADGEPQRDHDDALPLARSQRQPQLRSRRNESQFERDGFSVADALRPGWGARQWRGEPERAAAVYRRIQRAVRARAGGESRDARHRRPLARAEAVPAGESATALRGVQHSDRESRSGSGRQPQYR